MKKILFFSLLISPAAFSQIDSSKTKVSIIIPAKVCEYIVKQFDHTNKYEDIDSTMKKKFRVFSPPVNNNNVQIDSIENRVLFDIYQRLIIDRIALCDTTKFTKNFEDGCRQTGSAWLNNKINRTKGSVSDQGDNMRSAGRDYLRKQEN